jgi:hypothetical protein
LFATGLDALKRFGRSIGNASGQRYVFGSLGPQTATE